MKSSDLKGNRACVRPCFCPHTGQDAIHGRHNRVHNLCLKVDSKDNIEAYRGWRCTACGTSDPC